MSKQPKPWVESMLVAYVDHQLDPAQMAVVDGIIREDPEARTIVSVLRGSAEALKVAFNRPLHETVPVRLLAALGAAEKRDAAATVVPIRRPARFLPLQQVLTALAASIAILFVGIGTGYLQFAPAASIRPQTGESGGFEASLYRALEREQFGVGVSYDDAAAGRSGAVTVIGKVQSSLGDACREFRHEWTHARGKGVEGGLACRSATGDWSILTVPQGPAG
jgi:surface antigen